MKKFTKSLLALLFVVVSLFAVCACDDEEKGTKYSLSEVDFANITVEHYEYSYIRFDFESGKYILKNKVKQNGIVTKQTGTFTVDEDNYVTITNDAIPTIDYFLYEGETLYFEGDSFYAEAYIPSYGNVSMVFTK